MDVNVAGALTAYTYQSTLAQTGSASQALTQALAASRSELNATSTLLDNGPSVDAFASLAGSTGSQALTSLAYSTAAASGNGADAIKSLLSSLNGGVSALLPTSEGMPASAALLSPSTASALVRYAYDQSQNPANTAAKAAASGQQALLSSGLNLLA
jgi:hypothetical protein